MEYYVNTDGSCRVDLNKAGASCIILTKKKYIHAECAAITSTYALEAELYGIIMCMKYMKENVELSSEDSITLSVDSVKALRMCNAIIDVEDNEDFKTPFYQPTREAIENILETGVQLFFKKVKAHKDGFNTNKVADRLSKVAITHFPARAW